MEFKTKSIVSIDKCVNTYVKFVWQINDEINKQIRIKQDNSRCMKLPFDICKILENFCEEKKRTSKEICAMILRTEFFFCLSGKNQQFAFYPYFFLWR